MAKIIKSNGEEVILIDLSLKSLQKVVGGYIELLTCKDKNTLVINEEGKLKNLPLNPKATKLYGLDNILGDVVLCEVGEMKWH